ncbi:MAG: hypothetical protein WCR06_00405 [bacterium]
MTKNLIVCLFFAIGMSAGVQAADASFQLSLLPDVAIHSSSTTISGFSLNIWGMNPQERSLAIGFVNGSYGDSSGVSLGGINYSENYTGTQLGLLNIATTDFFGWQAGILNVTSDTCSGFQLGLLNYAGRLTGLQLGLFNMAAQAQSGMQIGVINLLPENRYWFSAGLANEVAPVMVLINWRR